MKKLILIVFSSFFVISCSKFSEMDQSEVCIFSNDEGAEQCKNGKIAYFQPSQWGNEQLPLSVIAAYCDFREQIIYNNSGVVCVFKNERMKNLKSK